MIDYVGRGYPCVATFAGLTINEVNALLHMDGGQQNDARVYINVVKNHYSFVWFNNGSYPPREQDDADVLHNGVSRHYKSIGAANWLSRTRERTDLLDALAALGTTRRSTDPAIVSTPVASRGRSGGSGSGSSTESGILPTALVS